MERILNTAVVGCGYWGPNLIRNFYALPESNVKKVCDLDSKRLAHIKNLFSDVETTTKFESLINDSSLDAIVIATPVNSHFELAKASLLAGKHTFIEKPMASSTEQCQKLIELAEKENLTLMVGHTFIYTPAVRENHRFRRTWRNLLYKFAAFESGFIPERYKCGMGSCST